MKQKILLFVLIWWVVWPGQAGDSKPWPGVDYVYIKAYLYNLDNGLMGDHAIVKEGQLDGTVVGEGVRLTAAQEKKIIALTNRDIRGLVVGLSKTYIPHHGLVFFDHLDRPVAYITISFEGEAVRVFPQKIGQPIISELSDSEIKQLLEILEGFRQVIRELGLPVFNNPFEYHTIPH